MAFTTYSWIAKRGRSQPSYRLPLAGPKKGNVLSVKEKSLFCFIERVLGQLYPLPLCRASVLLSGFLFISLRARVLTLLLVWLALGISLGGCAYSFRAGALPPEVRTIQIEAFPNEASLVVPTLSQTLTEAIRQKFITQTSLLLVQSGGDIVLRGRITDYQVAPVAIEGVQQAAQNRLSITIFVECQSLRAPEIGWQQSFMNFIDFPASASIGQVQEVLIQELCDRLAQDIVNKTLSNW